MNIVVYCSSQEGLEEKYQRLASELGLWIGRHGHTLLYGGSNAGLMHITASATHQAGIGAAVDEGVAVLAYPSAQVAGQLPVFLFQLVVGTAVNNNVHFLVD